MMRASFYSSAWGLWRGVDKVLGDAVCTLLFSWDVDDSPREEGICGGFCCLCPFSV